MLCLVLFPHRSIQVAKRNTAYFVQLSTSSWLGIHLSHSSLPPSNTTGFTSRRVPSGPRYRTPPAPPATAMLLADESSARSVLACVSADGAIAASSAEGIRSARAMAAPPVERGGTGGVGSVAKSEARGPKHREGAYQL